MRERARQIGADLQLQSEPGHGTSIRVILPLARAAASPPAPAL
jgi:signal transduction histidine kinase